MIKFLFFYKYQNLRKFFFFGGGGGGGVEGWPRRGRARVSEIFLLRVQI